jgi:protein-disulfide isomerase
MEEYNQLVPKESSIEGDTISIKKDALWKFSTFVLGAVVIVLAFTAFGNDDGSVTGNVVAGNNQPPTPSPSADPANIPMVAGADDDAFLGKINAPVTVIEFTDLECPFCERHHSQVYPQIKSQYIDTGKVKYVSRDFPLTSIHPNAQPAAEAAECVREQSDDETYFVFVDKIFDNQQTLSQDNLRAWANELGFDIASCMGSGKYKNEVQQDSQDAQAAGGRGTPFFVVVNSEGEGAPISGAQPFSAFQQAIEAALA